MGSILTDKLDALEIFNIAVSYSGRNLNNELVAIAFTNSTDIDCWFYSTSLRAKTDMTAYGVSSSPPKPIEGNGYYVVYSKRSDGLVVKKNISKYSFPLQYP